MFDLTLELYVVDGQIQGGLEYAVDLFHGETMVRMAEHYCNVLVAMTEQPELSVAACPLMGGDERDLVLTAWNHSELMLPKHRGLHELFEDQVARTPHGEALVVNQTRLSYGQLNARANRLARELQSRGVCLGSLVGVCLPAMKNWLWPF